METNYTLNSTKMHNYIEIKVGQYLQNISNRLELVTVFKRIYL